jgi:hypothetical protein
MLRDRPEGRLSRFAKLKALLTLLGGVGSRVFAFFYRDFMIADSLRKHVLVRRFFVFRFGLQKFHRRQFSQSGKALRSHCPVGSPRAAADPELGTNRLPLAAKSLLAARLIVIGAS